MQQLTVMQDPVADALDDMAALGLHWTRNRERGRMPSGIRQAMLLVAREALMHDDMAKREVARQFGELCGPAAFEKTHGEVCRYPDCRCPFDAPPDPDKTWCARGLARPSVAELAELLAFVRGEGRWRHFGPGLTTHPQAGRDDGQKRMHAAMLILEQRGDVRRHYVSEGGSVTWAPNARGNAPDTARTD